MDVLKEKIDEVLLNHDFQEEGLLPILLKVQNMSEGKYITDETARYIADHFKIPYSQLYEVFTFFSAINQSPKGVYHIEMCNSTVCRVNHKADIEAYLVKELKIKVGETTSDNLFTLDHAPCFGACDISPSVRINKIVHGNLTVDKMNKILEKLRGVQNG